jgi:hypothetical protein
MTSKRLTDQGYFGEELAFDERCDGEQLECLVVSSWRDVGIRGHT